MVTEHPEAAQTLSQSGDDLKRQLQQNGTALLRLDIESSGQQRSGQHGPGRLRAGLDGARARAPARRRGRHRRATAPTATDTPLQTLSGSALVNVLA